MKAEILSIGGTNVKKYARIKKNAKISPLEFGVVCRSLQEWFDLLVLLVDLQHFYRKLKLNKKKTWFEEGTDHQAFAKKMIKEYKKLQTVKANWKK